MPISAPAASPYLYCFHELCYDMLILLGREVVL